MSISLKANLYRVNPMYEPNGEETGWDPCDPENATCFFLDVYRGNGLWDPIDGFDTWDQAQEALVEAWANG